MNYYLEVLSRKKAATGGGGPSSLLTGLKAYYPLSDLTESVGGLTLTNNNVVTFTSGKVGNAANFVAASSQSLTRADNAAFQMGGGNFSVALWIKYSGSGLENMLCYGESLGTRGFDIINSSGGVEVAIGDGTTSVNTPARYFNDGAWHLMVVTCDRAGNLAADYDNGLSTGSINCTSVTGSINSTAGLAIGKSVSGSAWYYDGSIDEVGIWNRILTSGEITLLWNGGAGTTYPF